MGLSEKKLGCIFSGKRDVSRVTLQEFNTVKPLNSRHLRVLKNLSVIERCQLFGGNFKKIVTFGTN